MCGALLAALEFTIFAFFVRILFVTEILQLCALWHCHKWGEGSVSMSFYLTKVFTNSNAFEGLHCCRLWVKGPCIETNTRCSPHALGYCKEHVLSWQSQTSSKCLELFTKQGRSVMPQKMFPYVSCQLRQVWGNIKTSKQHTRFFWMPDKKKKS